MVVEGESGWVWTLDSSGGATDINHRYDMGGNASVVQFNLGYVKLYRPDSFCAATKIISDSASVQYSTVQYSTVQYILILQEIIMVPRSCIGDYTVNQCSKTTLISRRPLWLLTQERWFRRDFCNRAKLRLCGLESEHYISPDRFCAVQCEQLFGLSLK